jgi:phage baseplate assembly protein W
MAQYLGISFPFRLGGNSLPAASFNEDVVRDSIIQLLMTPRLQRVMRPKVGIGSFDFIFENNNPALAAQIEREVRTVIGTYEPRVAITAVSSEADTAAASVTVTVQYVMLSTGLTANASVRLPTGG